MSRRSAPIIAAAALVSVVVVAGVAGGMSNSGDSTETTTVTTIAGSADLSAASSVSAAPTVVTEPTPAPVVKSQLSQTLGVGMVGDEVTMVQTRLKELGFEPGPIDGNYASLTQQAVWAFEKLVMGTPRAEATGRITNDMWQRMQDPLRIAPKRPNAPGTSHTEIYLPEQVAIFFQQDETGVDQAALIVHISSGDNERWREEVTISPGEFGNESGTEPIVRLEEGLSKTPGGVFEYNRMVEGKRMSALGGMWNPAYFNYGIAIHGALNIPLEPASHGCIRMAEIISRTFQDYIKMGDKVYVWDGIKEPEDYSDQEKLPPFNTVITTTTLTPPTTDAPATTVAPTAAPVVTTAAPRPTTPQPTSPPPTQAPAPATVPAPPVVPPTDPVGG